MAYKHVVCDKQEKQFSICNQCGKRFNKYEGKLIVSHIGGPWIRFCTACLYQLYLELCSIFEEPSHVGNLVWKNEMGFITGNNKNWYARMTMQGKMKVYKGGLFKDE